MVSNYVTTSTGSESARPSNYDKNRKLIASSRGNTCIRACEPSYRTALVVITSFQPPSYGPILESGESRRRQNWAVLGVDIPHPNAERLRRRWNRLHVPGSRTADRILVPGTFLHKIAVWVQSAHWLSLPEQDLVPSPAPGNIVVHRGQFERSERREQEENPRV